MPSYLALVNARKLFDLVMLVSVWMGVYRPVVYGVVPLVFDVPVRHVEDIAANNC